MFGHPFGATSSRVRPIRRAVGRAISVAVLSVGALGVVACSDDARPVNGITSPSDRPQAEVVQSTSLAWATVPSPNRGTLQNDLKGLAVVSASDVWAVGEYNPGPTVTGRRTLAEHWNGASWQLVTTPNASWAASLSTLDDVAAASGASVWAVGWAESFATAKNTTLVLHWDGVQWKLVPSPNPAGESSLNRLHGVAVVSANNVWAVGEQTFLFRALILHWNGTQWLTVANPCGLALRAVTVVPSTNTLWAVGDGNTCFFNGQQWVSVPPAEDVYFERVAAVAPNLVWAVGRICNRTCLGGARIERWDGTRWTNVLHPLASELNGVTAVAANDAWAVGDNSSTATIFHWDGATWQSVAPPNPNPGNVNSLNAVKAVGPYHDWAVEHYFTSSTERTWTITR
jgi:hypothetical protein